MLHSRNLAFIISCSVTFMLLSSCFPATTSSPTKTGATCETSTACSSTWATPTSSEVLIRRRWRVGKWRKKEIAPPSAVIPSDFSKVATPKSLKTGLVCRFVIRLNTACACVSRDVFLAFQQNFVKRKQTHINVSNPKANHTRADNPSLHLICRMKTVVNCEPITIFPSLVDFSVVLYYLSYYHHAYSALNITICRMSSSI